MHRPAIRKVLVTAAALAAMSLSGLPAVAAASGPPLPVASLGDSGPGAPVTHTATNGSTQISTEPRTRWPAEPSRVYGPYVSPEQLRLVAD